MKLEIYQFQVRDMRKVEHLCITLREKPHDIRKYLDFYFHDWITYRTNSGLGELSIGRWIGVSHKVGQMISYWVLTVSGHVISCITVQRLTNSEINTD